METSQVQQKSCKQPELTFFVQMWQKGMKELYDSYVYE